MTTLFNKGSTSIFSETIPVIHLKEKRETMLTDGNHADSSNSPLFELEGRGGKKEGGGGRGGVER